MASIHLNDADRAVIGVLRDGRNLSANIAETTGYERHYISQRLRRLREHGVVANRGNGLYELTDPNPDPNPINPDDPIFDPTTVAVGESDTSERVDELVAQAAHEDAHGGDE